MSLFGGEFFVREYVNCLNAVKTVRACCQEFADQSTTNQIIISDISQKWQSWKHYMCLGTGTQFSGLKSLKWFLSWWKYCPVKDIFKIYNTCHNFVRWHPSLKICWQAFWWQASEKQGWRNLLQGHSENFSGQKRQVLLITVPCHKEMFTSQK